ncbi:hypothetical protein Tco_1032659 [Tanacetum coccineum]|uniref:Reverse transcriptase domain-containing protein n=1 Tax=Tanacetum coccineum TaxID=301880 RepID=A0ABQ5GEX7_9ASTR
MIRVPQTFDEIDATHKSFIQGERPPPGGQAEKAYSKPHVTRNIPGRQSNGPKVAETQQQLPRSRGCAVNDKYNPTDNYPKGDTHRYGRRGHTIHECVPTLRQLIDNLVKKCRIGSPVEETCRKGKINKGVEHRKTTPRDEN